MDPNGHSRWASQQDAEERQPSHQQAARWQETAAPTVLIAGAAGSARLQGQGGRQRERRGGERGGRRVAHARGLGVLGRGAQPLHRRRHAGVIPVPALLAPAAPAARRGRHRVRLVCSTH